MAAVEVTYPHDGIDGRCREARPGSRAASSADETVAMSALRIGRRFQGPTDSGQGGWTAFRFTERIGEAVEVSLHAPVPLETDLFVGADPAGDRWTLDTGREHGRAVMTAVPTGPIVVDTEPVSIAAARRAREQFAHLGPRHPVPFCFSCGLRHDSMRVHAAALDEDRYATDWTVPGWAVGPDGAVDGGVLWAALDCTSAWYVCQSRGERVAFTVRYAAEILEPVEAGATYALVGWAGDAAAEWDGRKRHAAAAAFTADGTCVARSVSLWVSVDA